MNLKLKPAILANANRSSILSKAAKPLIKSRTKQGLPIISIIALFSYCLTLVSYSYADSYLDALGGKGGGQFIAPCPQGQNLLGIELRTGDDVDALRPVCITSSGPATYSAPPVTSAWYGGPGGSFGQLLCPPSTPVVFALNIAAEGAETRVLNNIRLYCGQAAAAQQPEQNQHPSAIFDGPGYTPTKAPLGIGGLEGAEEKLWWEYQQCPNGQVAIGVHGRAGMMVDAMGLICDAPRIISPRVFGKVNIPPPAKKISPYIYLPQILGNAPTPTVTDKTVLARPLGRVPLMPAAQAAQMAQETEPAQEIQPAQPTAPTPPAPAVAPAPAPVATPPQIIQGLTPLVLYWHEQRGDNWVTATAKGANSAKKAGYTRVRNEACIFKKRQLGTIPLKLYWSNQRQDFFAAASAEGVQNAEKSGYKLVRNEGFVYPGADPENTRIPLKLYWSKVRKDNFTTGTNEGAQSAEQAGYVFARIEGYALSAGQCQ